MPGVKFDTNAVRQKLLRFKRLFPDELARALALETLVEVKEVKRRTPVDKGPLRASVHMLGPLRRGGGDRLSVYCLIVAGGPSAPYAIYVHEDLEAIHPVGQAKFIESVILESRPFMAARVARRIELRRALA